MRNEIAISEKIVKIRAGIRLVMSMQFSQSIA